MRLFIGIAFDETVKANLAGLCDNLRALGCQGHYTQTDNLHLTLKFLGETDREKLPALRSAINSACLGIPAFEAQTTALGSFSTGGDERLIWLGIGQSGPLQELAQRLEESLAGVGFEKESRTFKPHLTLARRAKFSPEALKTAELPGIALPITEVTLFESTRINGRLKYLPLYNCKLN